MSTAAIREALAALLESIPNIGRVHQYERFSNTEKGFLELYAHQGSVRGWRISRVSVRRKAVASGRVLATSRWAIVGFLALQDAAETELLAGDLADAVIAAERVDPTLGGVARGIPVDGVSGIQLTAMEPVMFAGVLCHRVILQLDVQVYEGAVLSSGLDQVVGAAGRLIGAVVDRIAGVDPDDVFASVEGRIAFEPDDDPAALPAAIVTPHLDRADPEPETFAGRQRVDRQLAVYLVAPEGYAAGHGALAAGGLDVLRETVRAALLGWESDHADMPPVYGGGAPVEAPPGLIVWRDIYVPSVFIAP